MKFVLRVLGRRDRPDLEIKCSEFKNLKLARSTLSHGREFEEKYELLVQNYITLENEIARLTISSMVRGVNSYDEIFGARLDINRALSNLFTTCRMYVDNGPRHCRHITGSKNSGDSVKKKVSEFYDMHFEYRFMEELRNYVQHYSFPADWLSFGSNNVEDSAVEYHFELAAVKEQIKKNKKFKKSVLDEMQPRVDLKAAARKYIECLSVSHSHMRSLTNECLTSSRCVFEKATKRYLTHSSGPTLGFVAAALNESNEESETIPMLLDWDDIRISLQKRNAELKNLSSRSFTGTSRAEKDNP